MTSLSLKNICKSYGAVEVLKDISLEAEEGEFVVLLGPSGCGKSTLLHAIAGLHPINSGQILIHGNEVSNIPTRDRNIAMVFQSYALYPNMTVAGNIGFPLKMRGLSKSDIAEQVLDIAKTLQLEAMLDRLPRQLSGGQRQRVAIGRSLVRDPKVFLFDEPLSNLDATLRVDMRAEIKTLHQRIGKTIVYVTHDQVEAMTLADKIVVLRDGNIEQVGAPIDLYNHPENIFVAQFIGSPKMNFFALADVASSASEFLPNGFGADQILGVRPEHLKQCPADKSLVSGKFELMEHLGEYVLVHMTAESGKPFIAKMDQPPKQAKGEKISFTADRAAMHLFDSVTTKRLS